VSYSQITVKSDALSLLLIKFDLQ